MTEESRAQISVPTRDLGSPEDVRNRVLSVIARLKGHNPFAIAGRAQLRSALGKNIGEVPLSVGVHSRIWRRAPDRE